MKKFTHTLKTYFTSSTGIALTIIVVGGVIGVVLFAGDIFENNNDLNEQRDVANDAATIANVSSVQTLVGVYRINNEAYPKSSQLCVPYENIQDVLQGDVLINNKTTIYYCVDDVENPTQYRLVTKLATPDHQKLDIDLDTNVNAEQVGAYSCEENYCVGSQE